MKHSWETDRCQRCGLYRRKEGRGAHSRFIYRRLKGYPWGEMTPCFNPVQADLLEPVPEEFDESFRPHEIDAPASHQAASAVRLVADAESRKEREQRFDLGGSILAPVSLLDIVRFEFDPMGKFGGVVHEWKIKVFSSFAIATSPEKVVVDTYWYAEDFAKKLMKVHPCRDGIAVAIYKDGLLFRAWRGGLAGWKKEEFNVE